MAPVNERLSADSEVVHPKPMKGVTRGDVALYANDKKSKMLAMATGRHGVNG